MNRKSARLLAAAVALALLAAVPAGAFGGARGAKGSARAAATHKVTLSGFSFHPGTLTINRGDTVTWSWRIPKSEHNVTFHSVHSRTGSSGSLSVRFTHAGTFSYICTVHVNKGMRGKVIVR
jgi:plastocyanin